MTTYTNKHEAVIAMIKRHMEQNQDTISQLSIDTGIGRQQIHRWLNGSAKNIHNKSLEAVANALGYSVSKTPDGLEISHHNQKGELDMDTRYLIDLQRDKIESQSIEIDKLKEMISEKTSESTHWDNLQFDFIVQLKLKRTGFKFTRVITYVDDMAALAQKTGYTEDELNGFWAIKKEYGIFCDDDPHPISQIVSEESELEIERLGKTLPYIFDSLKNMVGNHYIPVPITYNHKDGVTKVHTITYNKVNWFKMTIATKVQFLET